jgi:hypothetical protein
MPIFLMASSKALLAAVRNPDRYGPMPHALSVAAPYEFVDEAMDPIEDGDEVAGETCCMRVLTLLRLVDAGAYILSDEPWPKVVPDLPAEIKGHVIVAGDTVPLVLQCR